MRGHSVPAAGLELKVPPDVVALVTAGIMWLASKVTPGLGVPVPYRVLAAAGLFAAGIALVVAGRVAFARGGTTFSPVAPDRTSSLVTTGIYAHTRNPMYLGTLLALLGYAAVLSNAFSLLAAAAFVGYIDRFQIAPEERSLRSRFGPAYEDYTRAVRRWA